MGKTTAGLPLRAGEHYERCPGCATVYRSKRRTRFRCPGCHRLAYAVPTPTGEAGIRRTLEGDDAGRVFRVIPRRREEGEEPPTHGDDVVLFLEEPGAPAPAPDGPPSPAPGPGDPPEPSSAARRAARARAVPAPSPGFRRLVGAVWHGSLGDLRRRPAGE